MSEPIPESIPTSAGPRSKRPVKKLRRLPPSAPASASAAVAIENLMADPEVPVHLPAASQPKTHTGLAPPPEIVTNVQGSSAGAGSGEFHVYKASRRREYERLRLMDEEAKKEEDDLKWEEERRKQKEADEERARKNREKRNRKKKGKGGNKKEAGEGPGVNALNGEGKKELKVRPLDREKEGDDGPGDVVQGEVVEEPGITIHDDD
jgi:hypothetical protein